MGLIRTTFEVVTPESAEEGDAAERGWVDETGERHTVAGAIRELEGCEASSSAFHPGIWYTEAEGTTDYETGAVTTRSYHLVASLSASNVRSTTG